MTNPNAVVTLTAGSLVLSGEQLVERYAALHLPQFWSNVVIVAIGTVVMYVGRDGVRGALRRLAASARAVWTGPTPPAAKTSTATKAAAKA